MKISMSVVHYREADKFDIPAIARIRAEEWGTEEFWKDRISGYMDCVHHPQKALIPRITYIALHTGTIAGFISGHLTHRYECDGELQWINVVPKYKRTGIASELLKLLATWFIEQKALRICVDVDPSNTTAQNFYRRQGAGNLDKYWLVWEDITVVLKK